MTDRHSATRVTEAVYKAAIRRLDKLFRRRALASRLLDEVGWGAQPLKELSESLAVFDAMACEHACRVLGAAPEPREAQAAQLAVDWFGLELYPAALPFLLALRYVAVAITRRTGQRRLTCLDTGRRWTSGSVWRPNRSATGATGSPPNRSVDYSPGPGPLTARPSRRRAWRRRNGSA